MSPRNLGVTLKRIRNLKKLTQVALGKAAKVHPVYIAQIEAGTKVPSIATLEKIAKALNVRVGRLLD
jgi:transcriptional regulator with XRE-family HTH domain